MSFVEEKRSVMDVVASFEAAMRRSGLASAEDGSTLSAVRGPATSPPAASARRSLADLAEFVERDLIGRCQGMTGDRAGQTWLRLDHAQVEALTQLSKALAFMAPYDDTIRRAIRTARSNDDQ